MEIKINYGTNDDDDCEWQEMTIMYEGDKSKHVGVYPLYECPEDAIIGRNLISCDEILQYMQLAYEAGKNGEDFTIEKTNEEE